MPKKKTYKFDPDWVVAPGETLADWCAEMGLSRGVAQSVAKRYGIPERTWWRLLNGTQEISQEIAAKLNAMTMISAGMWLALEHNFRVGLAAGKKWERP